MMARLNATDGIRPSLQVNGDFAYIRIQSNAEVRPFLADGFDKSVTGAYRYFSGFVDPAADLFGDFLRRAIGAFIQFRDDVFPGCPDRFWLSLKTCSRTPEMSKPSMAFARFCIISREAPERGFIMLAFIMVRQLLSLHRSGFILKTTSPRACTVM